MRFTQHSALEGQHAFLSASSSAWVNYSDEKLDAVYVNRLAAARGTELHEFAANAIRLGIKLPSSKRTLNMYVNDAIGFGMTPEVVLYHSDNAFGTADAIGFKRNRLRIHDLKMGVIEKNHRQLEVYAAYFCLEYKFKPEDIEIIMRIYQNDEIREFEGDPDSINYIINKIKDFDKRIEAIRMEALS
jgi:hypothetical protein